jgi:hypothetical protein
MGPIGAPAPRRTGRQTVGRNITWNWTCVIALQITDPCSRQRGHPISTNPQLSKKEKTFFWQVGRGSQMGAWHQDGLADWLSVVI